MLIAIAGGAGVGKSEAIRILSEKGYATIKADDVNAELLQDRNYLACLKVMFPVAFTLSKLDKRKLRDIIFSDSEQREKLNNLAHPLILQRIKDLTENRQPSTVNFTFVEIPLLIAANAKNLFDKIWAVEADYNYRIKRLAARDDICENDAKKILSAQGSEEKLLSVANEIILNNGNICDLRNRIDELCSFL
jgi:dephospho-CoA kinase